MRSFLTVRIMFSGKTVNFLMIFPKLLKKNGFPHQANYGIYFSSVQIFATSRRE